MTKRRAFTLLEVMISLVIIATIAALTIPFFARDDVDRAAAAASLLQSDLRFAQLATMSNPQDPLVVRFKNDGTGYWLAMLSAPNTPIVRADSGATWNITMGSDRARSSERVTLSLANVPGSILRFTPLGSVFSPSGTPTITLSAASSGGTSVTCVVSIDTITGGSSVVFP